MALILLAGWTLFAFGGAYFWTTIPLVAGSVVLAAIVRPRIARGDCGPLDAAMLACLIIVAVQTVPLPPSWRLAISPSLASADAALYFDTPEHPLGATPAPLSIDPTSTLEALAIAGACVLTFWCARELFAHGSTRRVVRAIATFGIAASGLALAQHATAPSLLYWLIRPLNRGASPYTPFVNKNDLAGWLVLALPLAGGLMMARIETLRRERRLSVDSVFDDMGIWLAAGLCAMSAGLAASLSRSGLTAGAASIAALVWLSRGRVAARGRAAFAIAVATLALIAVAYTNLNALMHRVDETVTEGIGGRSAIWQATLTVVHDYRVVGVGVGAYERAMSLYQPPHMFAFNHAHNEYLQILSEGGLVLAIPTAIALAALFALVRRRLRHDASAMYWVRAGAAASLVGVVVQSIWETPLRMPATAVLAAICAALAVHERKRT